MACVSSEPQSTVQQSSLPRAELQMVGEDEGRFEDADEEEADDAEADQGGQEQPRQ